MTKLSDRIHARRKELRMTADDVAAALGVNRATIYRYESQTIEKLPSNILIPLAAVLRTTPAYLLGWDDDANATQPPAAFTQEETAAELTYAIMRMTMGERKKLMDVAKALFPHAFED